MSETTTSNGTRGEPRPQLEAPNLQLEAPPVPVERDEKS